MPRDLRQHVREGCVRGTVASCTSRSGAILPMAPKAFFLPFQRAARASAEVALRTSRAPHCEARGLSPRRLGLEPRLDAVELHHQRGGGIGRVAGGEDALLHGLDGGLVYDLERRGEQPVGDDRRHRPSRVLQPLEDAEQGVGRLRQREQLHIDFDGDAEAAFGSHEEPREVQFFGVEPAVSQVHPASVREHHVQPPDVAGGDAVLEAVGPARVLGHVAADGAGALRRGIRARSKARGAGSPP